VPEAEFLHEGTIDILRVGNAYRIPYAAAFRCRSRELVPRLRAPTFFLAYPDDSLTANLKLLGELPPACRIQPMPVDRLAGAQREIEILRAHAPASGNARLQTARRPLGITRSYVGASGLQVASRLAGPQSGRPLVVIPPSPGSATMLAGEIEQFAKHRPVLALDAPGCGDSDAPPEVSVRAMAAALSQALAAAGVDEADLYARHGGCAVALEMVAQGRSFRAMVLEAPARAHREAAGYAASYAPPIEPRWDGTHLLSLWHATRNRRLFRPWFDQRLGARYTDPLSLDVDVLTCEVLAYLESWRTYAAAWKAVLDYPVPDRVRAAGARVCIASQPRDEFAGAGEPLPEPLLPRVQRLLSLLNRG